MVAGCGPKIAKLVLFILNFAVWLVGILLLSAGSYVIAKQEQFSDLFAENSIVIVGGTVIGLGIFIFLVGFCGCCGALKEGTCLLKMYFFFMILIICMEITAGVLAFVYDDEIRNEMTIGMTRTINETYGIKDAATESVDFVQKEFKCCGATNMTDYTYSAGISGVSVPDSCCKTGDGANPTLCQQGSKGASANPEYVWEDGTVGCVDAAYSTIQDYYIILGAMCFGLLIFEILVMVFACCVINGIEKGEYV